MKNKRILGFIFVFTGMLLSANVMANGQGIGDRNRPSSGGTHVVSGRVRLPDGRPAINARVTLSNTDMVSSSQTTDQDGNFAFSGMPEGNYSITVKADGYQTE